MLSWKPCAVAAVALAFTIAIVIPPAACWAWETTPVSARDMLEVRDLFGLSVSPDGRHAVVRLDHPDVATNLIRQDWYLISLADRVVSHLASAGGAHWTMNGEVVSETPQWSRDSQWIYYRALNGQEVQIWRVRRDGSQVEQLTRDDADIEEFHLDPDTNTLHYTVGPTREQIIAAERAEYENGVLLDHTILPGFPLLRSQVVNGRMAAIRLFRRTADGWGTLLSNTPKRRFTMDLSTRATREASPAASAQENTPGLISQSVSGDTVRTIVKDDGLYGGDRWGNTPCALAGKDIICVASGPAIAPRAIALDRSSGKRRLLFDPNPALTPERLGVAQTITLVDSHGASTFARLVLPRNRSPANKPPPLVITSYYCGGFLRGGTGDEVPEHVLAGMGFAALCVQGARPRSGADPQRLNHREFALQDGLEIYEKAIDMLTARGIIDPDRIALTGLSASASGTVYSISHSNRFAAAIISSSQYLDPILSYLYGARDDYRNAVREGRAVFPYDDPEGELKRISPALRANEIRTPLLMQVAEVEYPPNMQLLSALRDFGRPVEMVMYVDEHHVKVQSLHRLSATRRSIDWVNFWLRGVEDSDSTKIGQYQRWRAMREKQCRDLTGADMPWYCRPSAGGDSVSPKEVPR